MTTSTPPAKSSKKRKSTDISSPPSSKRQKIVDTQEHLSAKKTKKPALADEWTRTDPITGDPGRLQRKDTQYLRHFNRRRGYIERKRRKRYAKRISREKSIELKEQKKKKLLVKKKKAAASLKQKKKKKKKVTIVADDDDDDTKNDEEEESDTDSIGSSDDELEMFAGVNSDTPYPQLTTRFKNQVVVVVGGGRGIGQACAIRLAQEGARIYILDKTRFNDTCNAVGNALVEMSNDRKNSSSSKNSNSNSGGNNSSSSTRNVFGSRAKGIRCDATDAKQVKQVIDDIITEHGYIDVVVNCIDYHGKSDTYSSVKTHEMMEIEFDRVMKANLYSTFLVCKAVLPHMLKDNYGRIVNLANNDGKHGKACGIAYSCAKAAIIAATKSMGAEYAETGITINCISPEYDTYHVNKFDGQSMKKMMKKVPMGRICDLEEIASVVAFVASEENAYTTGFCYDVSGGAAQY